MHLKSIRAVVCTLVGLLPCWASAGQAVLELFTSQGCSSCPPADALLGELAQRPDVLALAFHVDYWNDLGWRDRFSLAAATERQRRYTEALGLPSAFTPQLVMDGRASFVGSDQRRILGALTSANGAGSPIALSIGDGQLRVDIPQGTSQGEQDINLIAFLAQASTAIGRGENSGRTLTEFNIVRQVRVLGTWSGQRRTLQVPLADLAPDATDVAVLLQRVHQGAIVGSARIHLR
jgi:hypothetical protein